jgi:hypothetical protein
MSVTEQRRPIAIIADVLAIRLDRDLAVDLTADILFCLRYNGYRLVSAELRPDLDRGPVDIIARSLVDHTRIAAIAAKGAAGWCLADLHSAGWQMTQIDPPDPNPPLVA